MRRGITLLVLLFGIIISMNDKINFAQSKSSNIPEEAIRLRIIANSNDSFDQEIKLKVRDEVIQTISPLVKDINDPYEARLVIYDNLEEIKSTVANVLSENEVDTNYYVDYGVTYFPKKVYNNKLYPAGKYEAVYIVLGEGEGDNWWCVLFPPLCLVDLATNNGDYPTEDTNISYSFLIVEKIKELLGYK
ncbi:stage II sporulation protein R [Mycoplasmatota bacterium]|nr:stage II sporulation protein R [Mycoplasmatota bacterium]